MSLDKRTCCDTFPGQLHHQECLVWRNAVQEALHRVNSLPLRNGDVGHVPSVLPAEAQARKNVPLVRGLLDYFPAALAAVAELSRIGNEQHNPGQDMHWARGKSTDEADCIVRHLVDRGTVDTDGVRHTTKVAWRALALLQKELEEAGASPGRAARFLTDPSETDPAVQIGGTGPGPQTGSHG